MAVAREKVANEREAALKRGLESALDLKPDPVSMLATCTVPTGRLGT